MQGVSVDNYLRRASDFFDGVMLMQDEPKYRYSTALLAIHAAISYSDALRVALGGGGLQAEDHMTAVDSLEALLIANRVDDRLGLRHLSFLIGKKNAVAYRGERLDAKDCKTLVTRAERFADWAVGSARRLRLEGWSNGD